LKKSKFFDKSHNGEIQIAESQNIEIQIVESHNAEIQIQIHNVEMEIVNIKMQTTLMISPMSTAT
jgi:hypothetical protein